MNFYGINNPQHNIPAPSPNGKRNSSLAVRQFLALARGEVARIQPANDFRVGRMFVEGRYCLSCYGVRWIDVVVDAQGVERLAVCWCCGDVRWR